MVCATPLFGAITPPCWDTWPNMSQFLQDFRLQFAELDLMNSWRISQRIRGHTSAFYVSLLGYAYLCPKSRRQFLRLGL